MRNSSKKNKSVNIIKQFRTLINNRKKENKIIYVRK